MDRAGLGDEHRTLRNESPASTAGISRLILNTGCPLSIVVIPLIGHDVLAHCLDRLPLSRVECIVVLREAMGAIRRWQKRYPSVHFLDAVEKPVPLRRHHGLKLAIGDVVGLIEDTSWPGEGWCEAVLSAFADPQTAAAGGPVRIAARLPNRYRALGFSEYGGFAPDRHPQLVTRSPVQDRPAEAARVPGNNMAFRRVELIETIGDAEGGLFEASICATLLARGRRIVHHPKMLVTYAVCDRHNASLATRLHHGRIYAAQSQSGAWSSRLVHLTKVPLLPIVLTARAMGSLTEVANLRTKLSILFWLLLMEGAWAIGEAVGLLSGVGKSIDQWR